jgi:hypothetical protein
VPGLIIEESDNKAEVKAEGIAEASKRISGRNRRQHLSNEFVHKRDLDFDSSGLGSKGVLGKSQRAKDPTLGGSSLEGNSVKWMTSRLPTLKDKKKHKRLIIPKEVIAPRPSPAKKSKS